ncbi:MAG TPA: hypothetical protein VFX47_00340 [Gammaproteobacteria bacterium]|nr:hypothetical protein [Gammaproteobacteria bacterium]
MIKRPLLAVAAIASMISLTCAFAAGDAAKQIATAEAHASMAAATKDIKMVHAHLHHVINCLVGPKGKGFDASAENPCKGMGDGALTDLAGQPVAHAKLEDAVKMAESGIHDAQYAKAHAAAKKTVALIKDASAPK